MVAYCWLSSTPIKCRGIDGHHSFVTKNLNCGPGQYLADAVSLFPHEKCSNGSHDVMTIPRE